MAYTKLNLKDYIDKWDAAKVEHLQNGIMANDDRLNRLFSSYGLTWAEKENIHNNLNLRDLYNQKDKLIRLVDRYSYLYDSDKEVIQEKLDMDRLAQGVITNGFTLYGALMPDIGERLGSPSFAWDCNIEGKHIIPIPLEEEDIHASYVKVSNNRINTNSEDLMFTSSKGLGLLMLANFIMSNNSETDELINSSSQLPLLGLALGATIGVTNFEDSYDIICPYAVTMLLAQMFNQELYPIVYVPQATDIFDEAGTYILYMTIDIGQLIPAGIASELNLNFNGEMLFYTPDKIWNLNQQHNAFFMQNEHKENSKSTVLTFNQNKIMWDGISHLPNTVANTLKVSSDFNIMFNAFKNAGIITIKYSDGTSKQTYLTTDDRGLCGYIMNDNNVEILIPTIYYTLDNGDIIPPGVYIPNLENNENYIAEITLSNVNIEKLMNKNVETNPIAYEEIPFELGEQINFDFENGNTNSYDFSAIENIRQPVESTYTKLTNKNIDLTKIESIYTTARKKWSTSCYTTTDSDRGIDPSDTIYQFNGQSATHPEDEEGSISAVKIEITEDCEYLQLECLGSQWWISEVGGPTNNPNPGWAWEDVNGLWTEWYNILGGSYIYLCTRDPYASFYLNGSTNNYVVNTINLLFPSFAVANSEVIQITEDIEGLLVSDAMDENPRYILLNVLTDEATLNNKTIEKGVHGIVSTSTEDSRIKTFVSRCSTEDIIGNPIVHKIDEKFLPEIPTFNLQEMGMEIIVPDNGLFWTGAIDLTQLREAAEKGPVKIISTFNYDGYLATMESITNIALSTFGYQTNMIQRMGSSLYRIEFGFSGKDNDDTNDTGRIWCGVYSIPEAINQPQTATIGQILSVKAIDENGKPIEWETIDLPKAAAAITDATGDTVSAEQFNTLLASLRAAGYLAIE